MNEPGPQLNSDKRAKQQKHLVSTFANGRHSSLELVETNTILGEDLFITVPIFSVDDAPPFCLTGLSNVCSVRQENAQPFIDYERHAWVHIGKN